MAELNFTLQLNIIPNDYTPKTNISFGAQGNVKEYTYSALNTLLKTALEYDTYYCISITDNEFIGFTTDVNAGNANILASIIWVVVTNKNVFIYKDAKGNPSEEQFDIEQPQLKEGKLTLGLVYEKGEGGGSGNEEYYTITTTVDPKNSGDITLSPADGKYKKDTQVKLIAEPRSGYTFVSWADDKNAAATRTITVTADASYKAIFDEIQTTTTTTQAPTTTTTTTQAPSTYKITVEADPAEGGDVAGGGVFVQNQTIKITASPKENYTFDGWYVNGVKIDKAGEEYTITVTETLTYIAKFTKADSSYEITVEAYPPEGGKVSGGKTYEGGAEVTITAIANEGYEFIEWQSGGKQVSTIPDYKFIVEGAGTYIAVFNKIGGGTGGGGEIVAPTTYEISVEANPPDGGEVVIGETGTTAATYDGDGNKATLRATAKTGYTFTCWKVGEELISGQSECTVTVDKSCKYTAYFEKSVEDNCRLTLNITPDKSGSIKDKASNEVMSSGSYRKGTTFNLVAVPASGYNFQKWVSDLSDGFTTEENTCTFKLDKDVTVTATFAVEETQTYTITVESNNTSMGTVSGGGTVNEGDNITITASNKSGYVFSHWEKDGRTVSGAGTSYTFTVNKNTAGKYIAYFTIQAQTQFKVTFRSNNNNYGRVVATVNNGAETIESGTSINKGTVITLQAIPETGYILREWSDGESVTSNPRDITVTEDITITAVFEQKTSPKCVVTFYSNNNSWGTVAAQVKGNMLNSGDLVESGTDVIFTAKLVNSDEYKFIQWEDGTKENPRTINVKEDVTVIATFNPVEPGVNTYNVFIAVKPEGAGTVTGAGSHTEGTKVTLTAKGNTNYTFVGWSGDIEGYEEEFIIDKIAKDMRVVASFEKSANVITFGSSNITYGNVECYVIDTGSKLSSGDVVENGVALSFEATPNKGYQFVDWTNGEKNNPAEITTFGEDLEYIANFAVATYNITVSASPSSTYGTVSGGGTYTYDDSVTLNASAKVGYKFVKWTKNGSLVSTLATYGFTANDGCAGEYVAVFAKKTYTITGATNNSTMGTVQPATQTISHGDPATLTPKPNTGYHFVSWNDGNTDNPRTVTNVTANATYTATFELTPPDEYAVVVEASPAEGGKVSGSGTYQNGQTATLIATPAEHYTFVCWKIGNKQVSIERQYDVVISEANTFTAYFEPINYTLTISANANGIVNSEVNGTYIEGTTITIIATPNTGYDFVDWSDTVTDRQRTIILNKDVTLVASFKKHIYTITSAVAQDSIGFGTVAPTRTQVEYGGSTRLTASANTGYEFDRWNDGNTSNPRDIQNVSADRTYTVYFKPRKYQITVTSTNNSMGTVSPSGTNEFDYNSTVEISASPKANHTFRGWDDGNTDNPRLIKVTGVASYTADFAVNSHTITVNADPATGAKSISGGGTYNHGTTVTLSVEANTGWRFTGWKKNNSIINTNAEYTFSVNATETYVATFKQIQYTITATSSNTSWGTVEIIGDDRTYGTAIKIVATPNANYKFKQWNDGTTSATINYVITENKSFIATFEKQKYRIDVTSGGNGLVSGGGEYDYGSEVTITAHDPAEHYHFKQWNDGDTSATRKITVIEPASYVAIFTLDTHTIRVVSADENGNPYISNNGSQSTSIEIEYGRTCELHANPNAHYHVASWNNDTSNTKLTRSVNVTGDATYVVAFAIDTFTVTCNVNNNEWGTVSGAGTYSYGTQPIISASASEHYHFKWWQDRINTNPRTLDAITANVEYTAEFEIDKHVITLTKNDDWGEVTGAGTYDYGTEITLVAIPDTKNHYHFVEWNDHVNTASRKITVSGDATYEAIFAKDQRSVALTSNNDSWGEANGSGVYDYGTEVTISATPAEHYHFNNWSDGNTNNPRTIVIENNVSLTAMFAIDKFTITADGVENGSVTNLGTYDYGTEVTIKAVPDVHYHFLQWNDDINEEAQRVIVVTENLNFIPTFEIDTHIITVDVESGEGEVDGNGMIAGEGAFDWGTTTTIEATASEHWHFVKWSDENANSPRQIRVTEDKTYYAIFEIDTHTVSQSVTGEGSIENIDTYPYGSNITLNAVPAEHWHFLEWNDNHSDNPTRTITVEDNITYHATFEIDKHEVTVVSDEHGTTAGSGTYDWNSTQTIEATPVEHWHFLEWSDGETQNPRTITVTDSNEANTYTAIFEIDKHNIIVKADGPGVIAVHDEGNDGVSDKLVADYGSTVRIYAIPDYKCFLINWNDDDTIPVNGSGDDIEVVNDVTYYGEYYLDVTVEGDATYTAYFDDIPKQVVTTLPPQPNSHAIIYNGADANSILCAELTKYLILEDAAEKDIEVEDIDVINYITVNDIASISDTHESVTICGVMMTDKLMTGIYNWFKKNMLFVPNSDEQVEAIKKIAININRVENVHDDCFKNMATYKKVTVPTQETIDALLPIDRHSFDKKIMSMMDLGEPVMYDYFINNILSVNTDVIAEIVTAGEEEVVEETKRLTQQFNRYGSDVWRIANNRKAVVMMTGTTLPAGFVIDEMFDSYDSIITFNRLNSGDFEVSIYNIMHQLKDWNGRRRLTTEEKVLLEKNMFDAGAYMHDHYQGTGTPVSGTAVIDADKFASLLKVKRL